MRTYIISLVFVAITTIFSTNAFATCTSAQIDVLGDGTQCEPEKFSITTTSIASGETFGFYMSAAGTFYIDWDDGTVETINRANDTNYTKYEHEYNSAGSYTVRFGGTATGYDSDISMPTITFNDEDACYYDCEGNWSPNIQSISGNLSELFPWLPGNSADGAAPRFTATFSGAENLTNIPSTLFADYTTAATYMFSYTFSGCSGLTSIPENLFFPNATSVTGADYMFSGTFSGCSGLTSLPANLFSKVTTGAEFMFSSTFSRCTGLTSSGIPSNLFFPNANSVSGADSLFVSTFRSCTGLTSIPTGLFAKVTTSASNMFVATFSGCTSLTGSGIPSNLFFPNASSVSGAHSLFQETFYGCTGLTSIPTGLFAKVTSAADSMFSGTFQNCTGLTSSGIPSNLFFPNASSVTGAQMFGNTFYGCTGLTSIPAGLFSKVTSAAPNMFYGTFSGCTNITGYIPPSTFSGLIAAGHPNTTYMWGLTFYNTGLVTTCPTGTKQFTTGYEGSNTNGSTWNGKVSCLADCGAGKYLPAAGFATANCPAGSYCDGSVQSFSYNASAPQGLTSACPTGYTSNAGASAEGQCYITVTGGHYIGTAGQNSTNWGTCAAGYAKAQHTVNYGGTSSCEQCTTDPTTGRPAYTDAAGATSCTACPAVTGELASRATGHYSGYWANGVQNTINGCYTFFDDDDPNGTFRVACYYSETDGAYGGPNSHCDLYTSRVDACAAGYGNAISGWNDGYGVDFIKGQVCAPCSAGTYSADGSLTCSACTGATYSGPGAASCTACPTGYNYNTTNGKSSVTQCQTNCAAGQWISAPGTLLPNGYTRIEYLESTGTQYIDTGIKLTSNDVIYEWNAKDNDNGDYATSLFGAEYDTGVDHNGDNRLFSGVLYSTCRSRGLWLGAIHSAYMAYDSCDNEFHAWQLAVNSNHTVSLTKDGVQTAQISWSDELNKANNIFIYANNMTGYAGQLSSVAYKYFKITDNGRLVFDGIPARRNSDGELGMYDTVTGNFLTNAGSGTFVAGPDVGGGTGACTSVGTGYSGSGGVANFGSTLPRTANTITINWAGANGVFETGQCTYDGGISTPTTIPTKRGHVFNGWKFTQ